MSPYNTREEFRQQFKADNIDAIFRINPVGRIYGVTFIGYNEGIVANGLILRRAFSANVFNELYPASSVSRRGVPAIFSRCEATIPRSGW